MGVWVPQPDLQCHEFLSALLTTDTGPRRVLQLRMKVQTLRRVAWLLLWLPSMLLPWVPTPNGPCSTKRAGPLLPQVSINDNTVGVSGLECVA